MAAEVSNGFTDFYGLIGGDPDLPAEELKKLYHDKLREYHPDKRPESAGGTGQRMTQSLNEGWEILRDPQKKEAYDATWRREKEKVMPAHERADLHRRRGNELYGKAREMTKDGGNVMNLAAVHQSMRLYKSAMEEYTIAMESGPSDHRLYSNRALCYLAVEDWERAKADALYCARLRPDFKKAWLLVTKALWKMGRMEEASDQLQQGLRHLPSCAELLELQADFSREAAESSFRQASRSVSPVYTPTPSRQQTPTRNGPGSHGSRPVSPPLLAAGRAAATYAGPSSRSPGPSARSFQGSPSKMPPNLDASGTFQTGNFGAPTPSFAAANDPNMARSFPANAQTMWAGNAGQRSSYSPGPSHAGHSARSTHSPGPAFGHPSARSSHSPGPGFGGPDLGSSGRATSRETGGPRKSSASLKGMLDSSTRSRGNTPPSRHGTPPRTN